MKPETPATSSARKTKVKNMAYWETQKKNSQARSSQSVNVSHGSFTDQFEHPRTAAARGEAAKQSEYNDDGSSPDEDIWRVGALISNQGDVGLQAHLPPHTNSQQDDTCDLEIT